MSRIRAFVPQGPATLEAYGISAADHGEPRYHIGLPPGLRSTNPDAYFTEFQARRDADAYGAWNSVLSFSKIY